MVRLSPWLRPLFPPLKRAYTVGTRSVAPVTMQLSRLRGGYLPRGVAETMEDAAGDGGQVRVARPEEVLHRMMPNGSPPGHEAFAEALDEVVPRVAVVELPGGRVLGPNAVVITGAGRWIRDTCWYFGTTRPHEHPMHLHPFPPAPVDEPGRLGVLASRGDGNYYHFLHDCVPRIDLLDQAGVEPPDRWYVPQSTPFQREILDLLEVPADQRLDSVAVPHVRAERLVVPGLPSDVERNPPWVSEYLRRRLKPPSVRRTPGRHLYLTRGELKHNRMVTNEAELLEALAARGFESVDCGALSVADQVRAFGEADVIVAPHGASLANLAFCSPGATLLEIFPAQLMVADYWKMADGVPGLEYRYLCGVGDGTPPGVARAGTTRRDFVIADITVDILQLTRAVDDILRDHSP